MARAALHVVFGSSPAGIVRQALSELGRRERVLDLMDNLSLGPIASDDPEVRGSWLDKELGQYDWQEIVREDANLPIKTIAEQNCLVAWYAPNRAESFAGFQWWLSQIDGGPVSIMNVPDLHFHGTDAMMKLIDQEVDLSDAERERHQAEWQTLITENAPLRIVQDGCLLSVTLEYFDDLIVGFVSNEWRSTVRVVGDAFSTIGIKTGHFIDDLFTCSRLRALAGSGAIEWDGDGSDMRGCKVRLVGADHKA